jgi:hypothetical protein
MILFSGNFPRILEMPLISVSILADKNNNNNKTFLFIQPAHIKMRFWTEFRGFARQSFFRLSAAFVYTDLMFPKR